MMPLEYWDDGTSLPALDSPAAIQGFLDELPYNPGATCRSPRRVALDRTANCMEGALFAAACLERLGHRPRLVDIIAVRDDEHVVAIFREHGRYGSVAKSNYTGLRFRNPVYLTVRELMLSYFEDYFNSAGELTMRGYTRPLDLGARRLRGWQSAENIDYLSDALDARPRIEIVPPAVENGLRNVSDLLLRAGLLGSDPAGLYQV